MPRSSGKQRLQPGGQDGRAAVALQLHRILPGIGVGRTGVDSQGLVDHTALEIPQRAQHQFAIRRLRQRNARLQVKNLPGDLCAAVTGEPQNADGTGNLPRSDGRNGICHIASPPFASFLLIIRYANFFHKRFFA